MQSKSPFFSKTIWLNVIMGIAVALMPLLPQAASWKAFIDSNMSTIGASWAVAGILLRFLTQDKVQLGD